MSEIYQIAANCLGITRHHITDAKYNFLRARLREINFMCRNAGGQLRSRQVIAKIVWDWQQEQELNNQDQ